MAHLIDILSSVNQELKKDPILTNNLKLLNNPKIKALIEDEEKNEVYLKTFTYLLVLMLNYPKFRKNKKIIGLATEYLNKMNSVLAIKPKKKR